MESHAIVSGVKETKRLWFQLLLFLLMSLVQCWAGQSNSCCNKEAHNGTLVTSDNKHLFYSLETTMWFFSGQQVVAFLYAEVQSSFILLLHHPPELWSPTLLPPATSFVEDNFSIDGVRGWFQGDSNALHLLCPLFLSLLHQLHFRSSGIQYRRLEMFTPGQWFSIRSDFTPGRHLAMSGDIFP